MRKLSLKQKRFVKEYIANGGNGTQAALKVYDTKSDDVAQTIASENISKPIIKQSIDEIANSQGLTPSVILSKFSDISSKTVEKWSGDTVLKATVEMARILGMYPSTKHSKLNINVKGNIKDLNFTEVKKELKVIDSELGDLLEETSTLSDTQSVK